MHLPIDSVTSEYIFLDEISGVATQHSFLGAQKN